MAELQKRSRVCWQRYRKLTRLHHITWFFRDRSLPSPVTARAPRKEFWEQ